MGCPLPSCHGAECVIAAHPPPPLPPSPHCAQRSSNAVLRSYTPIQTKNFSVLHGLINTLVDFLIQRKVLEVVFNCRKS